MTQKIPATVVTGFLGAGKTTLIRHLLQNANGRRLALIVNEFGEIGVDAEILRGCGVAACADEDIVELANGCICCTVADDFLPTIIKLLDRPVPPDHIVIETSGLALPKPLVQAFNWPEVRHRVTVDGVIAVVDGAALAEGRFATDERALAEQRAADPSLDHDSPVEELFEDQLACADLVVLNKSDLLAAADLLALRDRLTKESPHASRIVPARNGAIDPALALGLDLAVESRIESRKSHHDDEEEHGHEEFASFHVDVGAGAGLDEMLMRLRIVLESHDVLRMKGFLAIDGKPMRLLVQGVGRRLTHHFDRDWRPGEERAGRLVFIGEAGLDEPAIRAAFAS